MKIIDIVDDIVDWIRDKIKENEKEPEVEVDIGMPVLLVIVGMIAIVFAIFLAIIIVPPLVEDAETLLMGIVLVAAFLAAGFWLIGYALFWRVTAGEGEIAHYSIFFGVKKTWRVEEITKVQKTENGSLKAYKGRKKLFYISYEDAFGMSRLEDYFEKEGVKIEDLRGRPGQYMICADKLGKYGMGECSLFVLGILLFGLFIAEDAVIKTWAGREYMMQNIAAMTLFIFMESFCFSFYLYCQRFYVRGNGDVVAYRNPLGKEKTLNWKDDIYYKIKDGESLYMYKNGKLIFFIMGGMKNEEFFIEQLKEKRIKCVEDKRKIKE